MTPPIGTLTLDVDNQKYLPVAQLDNATDSDSVDRWFESSRAGQNKNVLSGRFYFGMKDRIRKGVFVLVIMYKISPKILLSIFHRTVV